MKYLKTYESKTTKNTKIVFYWTLLNWDREFEKVVFETIVGGDLDKREADDWDRDNSDYIYNKFDFHVVFDHVIMYVEPTNEPVKDVEIIKTIDGKLSFHEPDDELTKLRKETEEIKKEITQRKADLYDWYKKQKEKEERKKKDYPSCWIDPSGNEYRVRFAGHEEFAIEWLEQNNWTYDDIKKAKEYGGYHYEILEKEGWVRILGWTDPPTFSLPKKLTTKQRKAIKDYCQANEADLPSGL